jgi:hypothetical protein
MASYEQNSKKTKLAGTMAGFIFFLQNGFGLKRFLLVERGIAKATEPILFGP